MLLCDVATCGSFIFRFDPQEVVAEPPRNRGKPQAFRGGVQQQCAPSFVVAAYRSFCGKPRHGCMYCAFRVEKYFRFEVGASRRRVLYALNVPGP